MNKFIATNSSATSLYNESIKDILSRADSNMILALAGMTYLTIVVCVGLVSFTKSEMFLSKDGLVITHPRTHDAAGMVDHVEVYAQGNDW